MAKWITLPRTEGLSSRQAHADLPPNSYERELGKEGFFGPATHMYHKHPPTAWATIDGPLKPRAFDTNKIPAQGASPWNAALLLHNSHLALRYWRLDQAMDHLVRNSDGDELLFVHGGAGQVFCDYGHLPLNQGDYLLLPRGTMWRLQPTQPLTLFLLEATNTGYRLPDKGLLGHHALFDPAVFDTPHIDADFVAQQDSRPWELVVKRRNLFSRIGYDFNPLDAVGWHGELMPLRVNWRDIRPLMSHRYHLPPSAHTTFLSERFVVCTFCPRPLESDNGALKVPFFHNNDDYDEVIIYHQGQFFSRDNIHPGMITLHPSGITHGPHPKALQTGLQGQRSHTDEVAVMIDSRDALTVAPLPQGVEWETYQDSWKS
jgi:homogentisate 1,2-dioxygenase